jgi:hypothetical protein
MIYRIEDKNNHHLNRYLMGQFRRFLNDTVLKDIHLQDDFLPRAMSASTKPWKNWLCFHLAGLGCARPLLRSALPLHLVLGSCSVTSQDQQIILLQEEVRVPFILDSVSGVQGCGRTGLALPFTQCKSFHPVRLPSAQHGWRPKELECTLHCVYSTIIALSSSMAAKSL